MTDFLLRNNIIRKFMLAIFYDAGHSSDVFEEITNVKSFGLTSLWANIGGYIGMVLGLSFFQVPDMVSGVVYYIQRKIRCLNCRRTSETSSVGT